MYDHFILIFGLHMKKIEFRIQLGNFTSPVPQKSANDKILSSEIKTGTCGGENTPAAQITFDTSVEPIFQTKCVFDVYGMTDFDGPKGSNTNDASLTAAPNFTTANILPSATNCTKADDTDSSIAWVWPAVQGNSFRHSLVHYINKIGHGITIPYSDVTSEFKVLNSKNTCHFEVQNHSCDDIHFDAYNIIATTWPQRVTSSLVDANYRTIISDTTAQTINPSLGKVTGVQFLCGPNNTPVNFGYNDTKFDISVVSGTGCDTNSNYGNCRPNEIIFTKKSTVTDTTLEIGTGNGSCNATTCKANNPFRLNDVPNQNGIFYLNPICMADGTNYYLVESTGNVLSL